MPELPEVEAYRRLAERALHRRIAGVATPDAWYLKGGVTGDALAAALVGRSFVGARRTGKVLLLDSDGDGDGGGDGEGGGDGDGDPIGPVLGLRFGMTGRLLVDGRAGVDALLYSSDRAEERWDRFVVRFVDGGDLRMRDPRRLGGVTIDPDEERLGVDALAVRPAELAALLRASTAPVKARLMDQARVAGIGNLLADEALWRAGIDPARPSRSLGPAELRRLHRHLRATVDELMTRGGSHTGDLQPERRPGGRCPRDGEELVRRTVGGRTTWSCPRHQR